MTESDSVLLLKFKLKCMLQWNAKSKYNIKLSGQCKGNLKFKFKLKLRCSGLYLYSEYPLCVNGVGSISTYERTEGLSSSTGERPAHIQHLKCVCSSKYIMLEYHVCGKCKNIIVFDYIISKYIK